MGGFKGAVLLLQPLISRNYPSNFGFTPQLGHLFYFTLTHLSLPFGTKQGPLFSFVLKSSMAPSSLEMWLGEQDAVKSSYKLLKEEVVTSQAWAEPIGNKNDLMHKRLK